MKTGRRPIAPKKPTITPEVRAEIDAQIREDCMFLEEYLRYKRGANTIEKASRLYELINQRWTHLMTLLAKYYSLESIRSLISQNKTNEENLHNLIFHFRRDGPLPHNRSSLYYQTLSNRTKMDWSIYQADSQFKF